MRLVAIELQLDIPDIALKRTILARDVTIVEVESTVTGTICHKCGQYVDKPYGKGREIDIRHLSAFGKPVYIRIAPPRYQCTDCAGEPVTTQRASWHTQRSPFTLSFENRILASLTNGTVEDTALKEGIGYEAVMGVLGRRMKTKTDWESIDGMDFIGLDEISLKKGHKDFVTVVSALSGDDPTVLTILEGRKKETVKRFLETVPERLEKKLKGVCSDMYDGYINAAKEVFGKNVKVIADRFHVAKLYRSGLEKLRKKEMRRLKDELPKEEYKKLNGVMWKLRKKPEKLNDEERETLEILFEHSFSLRQAYGLCNDLTSIYEEKISRSEAEDKMKAWMLRVAICGLKTFDSFLATLSTRWEEIANYFIDRQTSGFVEGLNNKIKVLKRRCYGITNIGHLFQRILLDLKGYSMFA